MKKILCATLLLGASLVLGSAYANSIPTPVCDHGKWQGVLGWVVDGPGPISCKEGDLQSASVRAFFSTTVNNPWLEGMFYSSEGTLVVSEHSTSFAPEFPGSAWAPNTFPKGYECQGAGGTPISLAACPIAAR